jgi:hypothetical protein
VNGKSKVISEQRVRKEDNDLIEIIDGLRKLLCALKVFGATQKRLNDNSKNNGDWFR